MNKQQKHPNSIKLDLSKAQMAHFNMLKLVYPSFSFQKNITTVYRLSFKFYLIIHSHEEKIMKYKMFLLNTAKRK